MRRAGRRPKYLRAAAISVLVILLLLIAVWRVSTDNSMRFDSAAWKQAQAESSLDSIRLRMVDDLLARHDLGGRSRADIVELLGEPDETEYFRDYEMVWWLGPERSYMSVDSEWLVVDLNESGVVVEARIRTD